MWRAAMARGAPTQVLVENRQTIENVIVLLSVSQHGIKWRRVVSLASASPRQQPRTASLGV
jgi:hypothetical protein